MILYPDCSYFHEEADQQDAPVDCEHCHRFEICKQVYIKAIQSKYSTSSNTIIIESPDKFAKDEYNILKELGLITDKALSVNLPDSGKNVLIESREDNNKIMVMMNAGKPTPEFVRSMKDHYMMYTDRYNLEYINYEGTKAESDNIERKMKEFNDNLKKEGKRIVKVLATVLICDEDRLR